MNIYYFFIILCLSTFCLMGTSVSSEARPDIEQWRLGLYRDWHALPAPPITSYSGPFGGEARAFIGGIKTLQKKHVDVYKGYFDWKRLGTYDPAEDPRPINHQFELAMLEEWRRMGFKTR